MYKNEDLSIIIELKFDNIHQTNFYFFSFNRRLLATSPTLYILIHFTQ